MKKATVGHLGTMSEKGWVVIPKDIRERLGLTKGAKVVIVEHGGMISVSPLSKDPIGEAAGLFAEGPSMTDALLRDRAEERQREEADSSARVQRKDAGHRKASA